MHFQSLTDPGLAPPGKHTLTLYGDWVPYRPMGGGWTEARRMAFAEDVLDTVAEYAPNIRDVVRGRMLLVPPDIEARFGITGGNIFHGDLVPLQRCVRARPRRRRDPSREPQHRRPQRAVPAPGQASRGRRRPKPNTNRWEVVWCGSEKPLPGDLLTRAESG